MTSAARRLRVLLERVTLGRATRRSRTLLLMFAGVALVAAAGLWDASRQEADSLRQHTWEQHLLAVALAAQLPWPAVASNESLTGVTDSFLAATRSLEAEGHVVVLLHRPDRRGFLLSDGRIFDNGSLTIALSQGAPGVTLNRDAARLLGLQPRVAVAGLARVSGAGPNGAAVAVVGSASAERDRGTRDEWRTVLTVLCVSLLILGVGTVALWRQRREHEMERRLAVHESERQRDVELARADRMAAIAALSSGIAHEISTPLGVISGRIEQLTPLTQDAEQQRLLSSMSQQVERINRVIRGFLGLARGDAPTLTHVPAGQVVREAAALVQHRFATARVGLRVAESAFEQVPVACDPALFEQVLVNLLVNALEASEPGQEVEIRLVSREHQVVFEVIDEGHGITRTAIAHATEPFFTTKAKKGGSGLGLAIAREIVAHHRGELRLERRGDVDTPGHPGTRATIVLPESTP
ncbi:MAG TPA: ATP-binding protein [Polyangiaceae bacterium]|nr:ATP-binding protein [Polyangiaceae bacterium]